MSETIFLRPAQCWKRIGGNSEPHSHGIENLDPKAFSFVRAHRQQVATSIGRWSWLRSMAAKYLPLPPIRKTLLSWFPPGPQSAVLPSAPGIRLKDLSPQELSDLLSTVIVEGNADSGVRPQLIIAADEVAHDPATPLALAQCTNVQEELEKLRAMLDRKEAGALVGMGPRLWSRIVDRVGEATSRAVAR